MESTVVYYKGKQFILIGELKDIGYSNIKDSHGTTKLVPTNKVQTKEQFEEMIKNKSYFSHETW